MTSREKIARANLAELKIVRYGDERLQEPSTPVEEIDPSVRVLADRMFELMFEAKGVGLAAPQVGLTVRLFVASPTFDPADRRVYVNPQILSQEGWQENEEGCLSVPGLHCHLKRHAVVTIRAMDLESQWFEETGQDLTARVFQHEMDHLDGRLIADRMGSLARFAHRRLLKDLLKQHEKDRP